MKGKFGALAGAFDQKFNLWAALLCGALPLFVPRAHGQGGVPLWTNRYHGVGDSSASGSAVAVDRSGNVFVGGGSDNSSGGYGYATIKYSNAGTPLWTNLYGPGGNGLAAAQAIALDGSGNVFVTGTSSSSSSSNDFATVAYSGAGVPLWTNCYHGPGNETVYVVVMGIALSSNGHVFVMGGSDAGNATVAYSSGGVPLWTNRYEGPWWHAAIAVDSVGNAFVTGGTPGSGTAYDFITLACSSTGVPLWTNRYNEPGHFDASAFAIAVDRGDHVFVSGFAWMGGSPGYATVAYSGAGVPLWTNRYDRPGNGGLARAVAVDSSGNVFVAGYLDYTNDHYGYATVAYSGAGVPLWTNLYNGPANSNNYALAVAVDVSGNVFVTGFSYGVTSDSDYATVAYSGAGVPLWTNRYNGPGNGGDAANAIAVDSSGNVFVTGGSANTGGYSESTTIKYSGNVPPVHLTIDPDGSSGYLLRLNGAPGSTYRLQRAPDVTGPWISSAPQTAPTSGLVEFHDLFPPPDRAFYRTIQP